MNLFKACSIFAILLVLTTTLKAQDSTQTAKIYFVRSTGYTGSLLTFHCFIDGTLACKLRNKQYSVHQVTAGKHSLDVTAYSKDLPNEKQSVSVDAVAGQSYYIKIYPGKSFNNKMKILAVSETTIRPVLAKCKQKTDCLK